MYDSEIDMFCIRLLCVSHLLVHSLSVESQGPVFASSGWNISPINAFAIVKDNDVGY